MNGGSIDLLNGSGNRFAPNRSRWISVFAVLALTTISTSAAQLNLRSMIVQANVVSDTDQFGNTDGRGSLTEKASELGLSDAEVGRIRATSGYVICPGTTYKNPSIMSASMLGNRMIVTALHAFFDDDPGRRRDPLSECYFRNQADPAEIVALDLEEGRYRFGKDVSPDTGDALDYAVVGLKDQVAGAQPFSYDSDEVEEGTWVLELAAHQKSPTRTFPGDQPVIQQCRVRDILRGNGPSLYIADCDASPLGSGGPMLTRNSDGELVVRGILIATGKQTLNGQPYDLPSGSASYFISTTGSFAAAIEEVGASLER